MIDSCDYVKSIDPSQRKKMILDYCGKRKKDDSESKFLNDLVLFESKSILKKNGKIYVVKKGKIDRRKLRMGRCYSNSVQMMEKGYGYVEGYVMTKDCKIVSHSWNVDKEGNHWDFTYKDTEQYEYYGVNIPEKVVWEVGEKNGHIWFSVLPFVDEDFNYLEIN
jgi:hypothetical protein